MNLFEKINSVKTRIYLIVIMITAVWAYKVYVDLYTLDEPKAAENAYQICITGDVTACPKDAIALNCGATLASVAKQSCEKYSLRTISNVLGGECGFSLIEMSCL